MIHRFWIISTEQLWNKMQMHDKLLFWMIRIKFSPGSKRLFDAKIYWDVESSSLRWLDTICMCFELLQNQTKAQQLSMFADSMSIDMTKGYFYRTHLIWLILHFTACQKKMRQSQRLHIKWWQFYHFLYYHIPTVGYSHLRLLSITSQVPILVQIFSNHPKFLLLFYPLVMTHKLMTVCKQTQKHRWGNWIATRRLLTVISFFFAHFFQVHH